MREQVRRKHLGRHLLSTAQNRRREPDLAKLRDLPRAEAIRIAMIMYGWMRRPPQRRWRASKAGIRKGRTGGKIRASSRESP